MKLHAEQSRKKSLHLNVPPQRAPGIGVSHSLNPDLEESSRELPKQERSRFAPSFAHVPLHTESQITLQPKLKTNTAGDVHEEEADRVAEQLASTLGPTPLGGYTSNSRLALKPAAGRSGDTEAPPIVSEVMHSPGKPLDSSTRQKMESRLGHDFANVRVHTDHPAARAAAAVEAKAYTLGRDIVFGSGEYVPNTFAGQKLLAHELTHVVQQDTSQNGTTPPAVLQRSALASWSDATDTDQVYFLSTSKRKQFQKQQQKLQENKTVKNPLALPQVDKIMNLSANYHHYDQYPTPEGGTINFDRRVIDGVQREFRMGEAPDFWPNIKWKANDGQIHDIGVKFNISFIPHTLDPAASNVENYVGVSLLEDPAVKTNPQDNIVHMQDIDKLSKLGANAGAIVDLALNIGLSNFSYRRSTNTVNYSPSTGGPDITLTAPDDIMTLIKLVREEAQKQGLAQALANDTLGYGHESAITFDPNKTAPAAKTYPTYTAVEGKTLTDFERTTIREQQTNKKFSPALQQKRLAAVVVHEIGHNIGMGHTDFGVMSESTEQDTFIRTSTTLQDPGNTSKGEVIETGGTKILKNELVTDVEPMTPENVQLLANRVRAMTNLALPLVQANQGAQKPTLEGRSAPAGEVLALLQANNYGAIFANDMYISLLAIPYQPALLRKLVSEQTFESGDKAPILNGMATEGHLTLAGWQQLSEKARAQIIDETKRLLKDTSSGVSFFPSEQERDAY